jgi:hypothetical protein
VIFFYTSYISQAAVILKGFCRDSNDIPRFLGDWRNLGRDNLPLGGKKDKISEIID